MLINAYNRANDEQRATLEKWLNAKDYEPQEKIKAVTAIYNEIGIDRLAEEKIKYYFDQSRQYLAQVKVDDARKQVLHAYADAMLKRKY